MNRQSILFILSLSVFLISLSFLWPSEGVMIGKLNLVFIDGGGLLSKEKNKFKDSGLIKTSLSANINSKDYLKLIEHKDPSAVSLRQKLDSLRDRLNLKLTESDYKESIFLINPVKNNASPLDNFFKSLVDINNVGAGVMRVGHYGDSQIEGGRMTNTLRDLFQGYFGGGGVGYVPLDDITSPVSFSRTVSGNWTRFAASKGRPKGGSLGPGGLAFKYNSGQNQTKKITDESGAANFTSWASGNVTLNLSKSYSNMMIWYGYGQKNSTLSVFSGSNKIGEVKLEDNGVFNAVKVPLSTSSTNIQLRFSGPSPFLYGATFDESKGVQFDNYGVRGHSGEGFLTINQDDLSGMFQKINNKLAIVQFGGNVTPYLKTEASLKKMKDIYQNIYLRFKKALPEGSVLIVSVNDVSRLIKGGYESYPNISSLRYIQRELAIENNCAFFDLYQFMGGESSINVWSEANLGAKDGHFSTTGRDLVAKELFKALMYEFNNYKTRHVIKE